MRRRGGIIARVYHSDYRGGCASDQLREITIVGPEVDPVFEPTPDRPAYELVQHVRGSVCLQPVARRDGGSADRREVIGPMFGGNFAHTSDSRVSDAVARLLGHRFYGAIAIHDRYETQATYDLLST